VIGRLADRNDFHRLHQHGRRARQGTLWMTWVTDVTTTPPRVGYSVGRAVGRAVTRNRLRRRFRAIMAELARAGDVPAGLYLLGAQPGTDRLSFDELADGVAGLVSAASAPAASPAAATRSLSVPGATR
jgi:ribonuclease P protein component